METFLFFVGIPVAFGLLQFFVTRSKLPKHKKFYPLSGVGLVSLILWCAIFGLLPLPETYLIDRGGFISFPDYFYVGLFCLPALFGIMLGALFGVSGPWDRGRKK